MKRVLITIDINNFQRENSRESMIHASNRWGVEFIPFSNKYYGDNFGVTFNKAIIDLLAYGYDEMMFLDADCIIRSDAPNPFDLIQEDKIIAVQNGNERIGNYPNTLNQHMYNLLSKNYKVCISEKIVQLLKPQEHLSISEIDINNRDRNNCLQKRGKFLKHKLDNNYNLIQPLTFIPKPP